MPSPFPGMNPYLEDAALWPGIHGRLIVAMSNDKLLRIYADYLSPQLRPKYFVAIEERQPVPGLSEADAAWADALLQEKGVR